MNSNGPFSNTRFVLVAFYINFQVVRRCITGEINRDGVMRHNTVIVLY